MARTTEETFYLDQPCRLTDTELQAKSDELAGTIGEHQRLADHKRGEMSRMNKELRGLEAKSEDLASQIRDREETRPIECRRVMDASKQRVATIRVDTGGIVDLRDMEPEEVERTQGEKAFVPAPAVSRAMDSFEDHRERFAAGSSGTAVEEDPLALNDEEVPVVSETLTTEEAPPDPVDGQELDLTRVKGVGPAMASKIHAAGFGTVDALLGAIAGDLTGRVKGMNPEVAERVVLYVETNFGSEDVPATPQSLEPERVDRADDSIDDVLGV